MVLLPIDTMFLFQCLFHLSRYAANNAQAFRNFCVRDNKLVSSQIRYLDIENRAHAKNI